MIQSPAATPASLAEKHLRKLLSQELSEVKTSLTKIESTYKAALLPSSKVLKVRLGSIIKGCQKINQLTVPEGRAEVFALMQHVKSAIEGWYEQARQQEKEHEATNDAIKKIFSMIESRSKMWRTSFKVYEQVRSERDKALKAKREMSEDLQRVETELKYVQSVLMIRTLKCRVLRAQLDSKVRSVEQLVGDKYGLGPPIIDIESTSPDIGELSDDDDVGMVLLGQYDIEG